MTTLPIQRRTVWGRRWLYPVGPLAAHVQVLTGRPTLRGEDLDALRGLGFSLVCAHCHGAYGACEETRDA